MSDDASTCYFFNFEQDLYLTVTIPSGGEPKDCPEVDHPPKPISTDFPRLVAVLKENSLSLQKDCAEVMYCGGSSLAFFTTGRHYVNYDCQTGEASFEADVNDLFQGEHDTGRPGVVADPVSSLVAVNWGSGKNQGTQCSFLLSETDPTGISNKAYLRRVVEGGYFIGVN